MALSMATAGVCHELGGYFNVNMKPGIKDFNVHLQEHAIRNAASLGVHAVVEGKLDGTAVLNSVKDTIIDALAAKGANHLGALPREMFDDQLCHKAGHFVNAFAAGAAKNLDDPFKKGLAAGVGAVAGEVLCEALVDKTETDDGIIGTEIKKARILVGTIAALMGLDVNAADWGANNAIENNFVPHQLNADVDVNEPDPEEERGRSSDQDDTKATRDGSQTPRIDDTYIEESKRAIGDAYHEVREGQEGLKRGEITKENLMKAAAAYSFDGLSYVAQGLDLATFGAASWVGEKLDAGAALAGTGVRRAARYITGDQRLAQNFGDWVYLGLTVANPLNKAALPAQVVQKFNIISNAIKSTKALDALGLEMRLAVNAEGKALKALDLAEGGKKPGLNIRPGQEWKLKIQGNAQNTKTPGHGLESAKEAIRQAKDPMIGDVYLDNGYHKALRKMGVDVRLAHNRRPDVLAVSKDGKLMRAIEVQSKSDREMILMNRNIKVAEQLKPLDIDVKVKIKQIPSWDYEKGIPKK